jgi:acyl carrier protein
MIYRTGDLGRLFEDGCLVHLGRKDSRAKLRGYRVEFAEVEQALLDYSGINTAVAAVRQDRNKNDYLVAYYTSDAAPAPEALRHHLSSRLPSYMIPTAFVALDKLPLTPNGKIDRAALPDPAQPGPGRAAPAAKPRDRVESAVLDIWRRVLDIEIIGIHDNFFDLGGHSLHAMRILFAAATAFNVQLSIRDFFDAPTIADMAAALIIHSHTEGHLAAELERLESLSDEEVVASFQKQDQSGK